MGSIPVCFRYWHTINPQHSDQDYSRIADAETHLREILRSRCAEQAPPELRARVLRRLSVMRSTASVTTAGGTMTVRSSVIRYTRG